MTNINGIIEMQYVQHITMAIFIHVSQTIFSAIVTLNRGTQNDYHFSIILLISKSQKTAKK